MCSKVYNEYHLDVKHYEYEKNFVHFILIITGLTASSSIYWDDHIYGLILLHCSPQ